MQLYDPTTSGPQRDLLRAPPLTSLDGKTIGILISKAYVFECYSPGEARQGDRAGSIANFVSLIHETKDF